MTSDRSEPKLRGWWAPPIAALAAAMVGAAATVLELAAWVVIEGGSLRGTDLFVVPLQAMFGAGVVAFGLPIWAIMHGLGFRRMTHAALSGSAATVLGVIVTAAVLMKMEMNVPVLIVVSVTVLLGLLPGALGGCAFQGIAYVSRPIERSGPG